MAKPQYDGPWRRIRLRVLERDGYRCQIVGPKCRHNADQVDHIIAIENGGSWWDESNLRASCGPCNNGRAKGAERWRRTKTRITLVLGPPGSDLAEHVAARRGEHDLVIDYDLIARSLGADGPLDVGDPLHRAVMAARNALIGSLKRGETTASRAWITSTNPKAESMFPWHSVELVDPGREVVLQANLEACRPARWATLVDEWYSTRQPTTSQASPSREWWAD
ncbi:MAG: hypothetical protein JWO62_2559 [Acidimicrobiaceae bacterium]|nr:hypothetical protein [Acidimicrobiaceae bacterium]